MRDHTENIIVLKTQDFALAIIEFSEKIYELRRYRNGRPNFRLWNVNWR